MSLALGLGMAGSALASLAGGLFTNQANANLNYRNRQWQEEMWNKQNDYNSPSSVLARYARAGISVNPNYLVTGGYDGGLASHVGNPAIQPYTNPMEGVNLFEPIARSKQLDNETKIANSQELKNNEEAALAASNKEKVDWENIITSQTYENTIESSLQNLELLKNKKLISDEEYKIQQQKLNEQLHRVREAKADADVAEERVNTQLAQTDYLISETELNNARVITEKTTQFKNNSEAAYYKAQRYAVIEGVKLTRAQAGYYNALQNKTVQETSNLKEYKNQIIAQTTELLSQAGLNDKQANKVAAEAFNLVASGRVDRAVRLFDMELKNTSQRYGTGTIGSTIGVCLDLYNNYRKWRTSPLDTHNHGSTSEW